MARKTYADLAGFVAKTLRVKDLGPDPGMGRIPAWDSLAHVNLVLAVEEWAGVAVPPELMGELTTLEALAAHLAGEGVLDS